MNLADYPSYDEPALLRRLAEVVDELCSAIEEKATAEVQEVGEKVGAYFSSSATTERGREMDGKRAAHPYTISVIELTAQIAALTEEKYLIIRLLDRHAR